MFYGCSSLEELDIFNFNLTNINNKYNVFALCLSLKSINCSPDQIQYLNEILKDVQKY